MRMLTINQLDVIVKQICCFFIAGFLSITLPIKTGIAVSLSLKALDIVAAFALLWHQKKSFKAMWMAIRAKKLLETGPRLILYFVMLIVAEIFDNHVMPGYGTIQIVTLLISGVEMRSIAEKIEKGTGLDIWSVFAKMLKPIGEKKPR